MPENAVKVDRSTKWGNPFTLRAAKQAGCRGSDELLRAYCTDMFRAWITGFPANLHEPDFMPEGRAYILGHIDQLRGHNLACWCPLDQPCHTDVLLELANREGRHG